MFLGLDVGDARVGVAYMEALGGVPAPLVTLPRANGVAEREIIALIGKYKVQTLVVGIPLGEDSLPTPQCDSVERFCKRITRRSSVNVRYIDEYGTSVEALERFVEARSGRSKKASKRAREKGVIDALAAVTILERYAESMKS